LTPKLAFLSVLGERRFTDENTEQLMGFSDCLYIDDFSAGFELQMCLPDFRWWPSFNDLKLTVLPDSQFQPMTSLM
jgi:hypothetical protein